MALAQTTNRELKPEVSKLYGSLELLWAWTGRTVRARYQQSLLGWLWALIQPAASVLILTVVFTRFVPVQTDGIPYVVFSCVAIIPWTFLYASLNDMTSSLVQNMNLVSKVYFPRETIPLAAMLARLLDFCVAATLMVGLMIAFRLPLFGANWLYVPAIFLIQLALIAGLGLLTSALNVFYRDVQTVLLLVLQVWFYSSPVIYPPSMVPERLRQLFFLNPMAGIIQAYRDVLLHGQPPGLYLVSAAIVSLILLILGYLFFKKVEFLFADIF